jgi:hypothetical protein
MSKVFQELLTSAQPIPDIVVLLLTKYMCNFQIPAITNTTLVSVVINFNFAGANRENSAPLFLNQQCPPP